MICELLTAFGGIALFIFGLKLISGTTEVLALEKPKGVIQRIVKTKTGAFLTGVTVSGVSQSSAVVNLLAVEFVEKKIIPLATSFAIIMGANVGTTMTAQLVSLSGIGGNVIGAIASIIGLLIGFSNKSSLKVIGNSLVGLGVLFSGLSALSVSITALSRYDAFSKLFLIKNPIVLYLNGLVLTSLVQSSSAITGVMVMLANVGLISFQSSVYLTLGSNVGSCFIVVFLSLNKSKDARHSAYFNLLFNFLGSVIFFPIFCMFENNLTQIFLNGNSVGRAIANFHTVFNLTCSLMFLPFISAIEKAAHKILKQKRKGKGRGQSFYNKTFI